MKIICDLLSTIVPPMLSLPEDLCRPDYPPLFRLLDPVVYCSPTKASREEDKDNA